MLLNLFIVVMGKIGDGGGGGRVGDGGGGGRVGDNGGEVGGGRII